MEEITLDAVALADVSVALGTDATDEKTEYPTG